MSFARVIYRIALRAYPPGFRRRYGAEMERVFAEGLHDARSAGWYGALRYHLRVAADLPVTAGRERWAACEAGSLVAGLAAVLCGGLIAALDLRASEVLPALLGLFVSALVLGCAKPRGAWLWAGLIAAALPAVEVGVFALRSLAPQPGHPYLSRSLVFLPALACSLTGAYGGVFLRLLCRGAAPSPAGRDPLGPGTA